MSNEIKSSASISRLLSTKNTIIDEGYMAIILSSMPAIVGAYFLNLEHLVFPYALPGLLIFFVTTYIIIYAFREKLPYPFKVSYMVTINYMMGIYCLLSFQMIGMGILFIFFSNTILTIHFSQKFHRPFFYGSIAILITMGGLIMNGFVQPAMFESELMLTNWYWIFTILAYAIMMSVVIRSTYAIHIFMNESINEITTQNDDLEKASEEMLKHNQLLAEQRSQVEALAYYDQLTGLPNRVSFEKALADLIETSERSHKGFGLFIIDIDNQKSINSSGGQQIGDEVIRRLGKNLKNTFHGAVMVARIDGDAFGIICPESSQSDAHRVFSEVKNVCGFVKNDFPAIPTLSCSAGMVFYPTDATTEETLMSNVELALSIAKNGDKNTYVLFDDSIIREHQEKEKLSRHLKEALTNNELYLDYQPIIHGQTNEVASLECLARWHSQIYGQVPPSVFIPLMESCGLIVEFGYQMLHKAITQLKYWHDQGMTDLCVSVNVSALQFTDSQFFDNTMHLLKSADLEPKYLDLEITESVFIDNSEEVIDKLRHFAEVGIRLSLDDFGTGYSSLSYLMNLPINTLKIDKCFVDNIFNPNEGGVLVKTVILLAHQLGLEVVAEGIENEDQLAYLMENKCDYLQGYYLGKPCKADSVLQVLVADNDW